MAAAPNVLGFSVIGGLLALAPGSWNPAWQCGGRIRAALGERARIAVDPRHVVGKIAADEMARLKGYFLVPQLTERKLQPLTALHTYRDVEDFATHGDDHAASRLFRWLRQAAAEGKPINARGVVCDTEAKMLDYYRTYLELFRALQREGYRYRGPDEICFGIGAGGEVVHMRRGTHRLVSAHFLGLPSVTGYVTHADPAWVATCRRDGRDVGQGGPIEAIAAALRARELRQVPSNPR